MAEVIRFPQKVDHRSEAMTRLAHRMLSHLSIAFYDRGIMDIPLQGFVRDMTRTLMREGHHNDPDLLDTMGNDPYVLARVERTLLRTLIERGQLPKDYKI